MGHRQSKNQSSDVAATQAQQNTNTPVSSGGKPMKPSQKRKSSHRLSKANCQQSTAVTTTRRMEGFYRVLQKIEKTSIYADYSTEERELLAERLSDATKLREHYLRTSFTINDPPLVRIYSQHNLSFLPFSLPNSHPSIYDTKLTEISLFFPMK